MTLSSNARILFIDDHADSSQLIDMLLYIKKCKYDFSVADTPHKALELMAKQSFDLFIIENKLPEMSGVQLCRMIRENNQQTPILFFSRRIGAFERETSLAAGATAYLVKPTDLEDVTRTIKQLLGENEHSFVINRSPSANYKSRNSSTV